MPSWYKVKIAVHFLQTKIESFQYTPATNLFLLNEAFNRFTRLIAFNKTILQAECQGSKLRPLVLVFIVIVYYRASLHIQIVFSRVIYSY